MSTFEEIIRAEYTEAEESHLETMLTFQRDYDFSVLWLRKMADHILVHVENPVAVLSALETVTDEIADVFDLNGDDV